MQIRSSERLIVSWNLMQFLNCSAATEMFGFFYIFLTGFLFKFIENMNKLMIQF